jgi:cellobiose phosphorylase
VPPHTGRGGWTWYTGSASWMYRLGIEKILGLNKIGNKLHISPCIPADWKEFEISYRFGKSIYRIKVNNSKPIKNGSQQISIDNKIISDAFILLKNDGNEHIVDVALE